MKELQEKNRKLVEDNGELRDKVDSLDKVEQTNTQLALHNTELRDKVDTLIKQLRSKDDALRKVARVIGEQAEQLIALVTTEDPNKGGNMKQGEKRKRGQRGLPPKQPSAVDITSSSVPLQTHNKSRTRNQSVSAHPEEPKPPGGCSVNYEVCHMLERAHDNKLTRHARTRTIMRSHGMRARAR